MYRNDLQVLSAPNLASGYHGVYEHPRPDRPGSGMQWVAVPFHRQKLPAIFYTPREAAKAVADKWREIYGPDWPRVFTARGGRPWSILARNGSSTLAARHLGRGQWAREEIASGGYCVFVWDLGNRTVAWPSVRKATCYSTRACAAAGLREWCLRRAGLFAPLVLVRAQGGPVHPPWVPWIAPHAATVNGDARIRR